MDAAGKLVYLDRAVPFPSEGIQSPEAEPCLLGVRLPSAIPTLLYLPAQMLLHLCAFEWDPHICCSHPWHGLARLCQS